MDNEQKMRNTILNVQSAFEEVYGIKQTPVNIYADFDDHYSFYQAMGFTSKQAEKLATDKCEEMI